MNHLTIERVIKQNGVKAFKAILNTLETAERVASRLKTATASDITP